MRAAGAYILMVAAALAAGCATPRLPLPLPLPFAYRAQAPAEEPGAAKIEDKKETECQEPKGDEPVKAIFEWAIGPKKNHEAEDSDDEIVTDRPDFTESSTTVGRGRVQLEAGYTYFRDRSGGSIATTQTYPEALLRIGLFTDWFELRIGETWVRSKTTAFGDKTDGSDGATDLYLGAKFAVTKQNDYLPEIGVILFSTVPTGARSVTANRAQPGGSFLYGWDVIPDLLTAGGEFVAAQAVDSEQHSFVLFAQSFTIGYKLTKQFDAYTEWFALYPSGAVASDAATQHYFNGGLAYRITRDFQVDIRAGVGLNRAATDFFAGAGFAVRY